MKRKGAGTMRWIVEPVMNALIRVNLWAIVFGTELAALVAFTFFLFHRGVGSVHILPDLLGGVIGAPLFLLRAGLWGAFFAAAWIARGILIQYIGDVAAYISPNALDRFSDLRRRFRVAWRRLPAPSTCRDRGPYRTGSTTASSSWDIRSALSSATTS